MFILAALFLLGGDTLIDFALALLIGIGIGTWSSVFVATPCWSPSRAEGSAASQQSNPVA